MPRLEAACLVLSLLFHPRPFLPRGRLFLFLSSGTNFVVDFVIAVIFVVFVVFFVFIVVVVVVSKQKATSSHPHPSVKPNFRLFVVFFLIKKKTQLSEDEIKPNQKPLI